MNCRNIARRTGKGKRAVAAGYLRTGKGARTGWDRAAGDATGIVERDRSFGAFYCCNGPVKRAKIRMTSKGTHRANLLHLDATEEGDGGQFQVLICFSSLHFMGLG